MFGQLRMGEMSVRQAANPSSTLAREVDGVLDVAGARGPLMTAIPACYAPSERRFRWHSPESGAGMAECMDDGAGHAVGGDDVVSRAVRCSAKW